MPGYSSVIASLQSICKQITHWAEDPKDSDPFVKNTLFGVLSKALLPIANFPNTVEGNAQLADIFGLNFHDVAAPLSMILKKTSTPPKPVDDGDVHADVALLEPANVVAAIQRGGVVKIQTYFGTVLRAGQAFTSFVDTLCAIAHAQDGVALHLREFKDDVEADSAYPVNSSSNSAPGANLKIDSAATLDVVASEWIRVTTAAGRFVSVLTSSPLPAIASVAKAPSFFQTVSSPSSKPAGVVKITVA